MIRRFIFTLLVLSMAITVQAQGDGIDFPDLTGPFQVGRVDIHMVDDSREEVFSEDSDDMRELLITVYYPADPAEDATPAPYLTEAWMEVLGFPPQFGDAMRPHSYLDAPLSNAEEHYPLLIFSPGLAEQPQFYSSLLEELTSHGYIVASVFHPYSVGATIFPDGRTILANEAGTGVGAGGLADTAPILRQVNRVWAEDVIFVLDQLTLMNENDERFAGRLDLDRVGIFGHSLGGATAAQASYLDDRFKAALDMDGHLWDTVAEDVLQQPFMVMVSGGLATSDETGEESDRDEIYIYHEDVAATWGYLVVLNGAVHTTYTLDMLHIAAAIPGIFPEEATGTIDPERSYAIITTYVRAFFARHIQGEDVPFLDGPPDDYQEIEFEVSGP